jgi:hypothetical protein
MDVEVISHDVANAKAEIKFIHNGVTHQEIYDLDMVIPSTKQVFASLGMEFDSAAQAKAIEHQTEVVKRLIEAGYLKNKLPLVEPIPEESGKPVVNTADLPAVEPEPAPAPPPPPPADDPIVEPEPPAPPVEDAPDTPAE